MVSTLIKWSVFGSFAADRILREEGDWASLLTKISTSGPHSDKKSCPWVKLAKFGDLRSAKNSLRHDDNVVEIYGVEGDYDGEVMQPEQAVAKLEDAQVRAIIYTSPSHTPDKPRWRVLAPLAEPHSPNARQALLARINGVLGGVLSGESFTLSQSYFFGRVADAVEYKVLATFDDPKDGFCVDTLDELDNCAVGRSSKTVNGVTVDRVDPGNIFAMKVQDLGRKLKEGDGRREMLKAYIASRSKTGWRGGDLVNLVRGVAASYFDGGIDEHDISTMVEWANSRDEQASAEAAKFVEDLLAGHAAKQTSQVQEHPLAKFVALDMHPKPPRWVIPGFIGHGVVTIAGAHGVGKTTAMLPLAMIAAGLHQAGDPLAPRHWRHVVYIVEDLEQSFRILAGATGHGNALCAPKFTTAQVQERMHIVEARRLDPAYVAQVGALYREKFTRIVDGVEILPLVVVDTKAAVLELDNENDNSEASRAMAALKQGFNGLPTWLIGHVAKQNIGRADVAGLSLRGGSAFEADANQVLFLVKEADESRWLVRGKTRFEALWAELQIHTSTVDTVAADEFGIAEKVTLRWGVLSPPEINRKEAKEEAQKTAQKDHETELRTKLLDAAQIAWIDGNPMSKRNLRVAAGGKTSTADEMIDKLLGECWLYEIEVPARQRINNNKKIYLVRFADWQRRNFMESGVIPDEYLSIPQTWGKATEKSEGTNGKLSTGEEDMNSVGSIPLVPLKKKQQGTNGTTGSVVPMLSTSPVEGNQRGTNGNQREPTEQKT